VEGHRIQDELSACQKGLTNNIRQFGLLLIFCLAFTASRLFNEPIPIDIEVKRKE
jgi:hypothetical protein